MTLNFGIHLADTDMHPDVIPFVDKMLFVILLCTRLIFMTENYLDFTNVQVCAMFSLFSASHVGWVLLPREALHDGDEEHDETLYAAD